MEGWKSRPKCFKFLEGLSSFQTEVPPVKGAHQIVAVCRTPRKCVFVRVVDTCAGCAPGSKHIDMTRAAFGELASYDTGVLQVNFRPATEPDSW